MANKVKISDSISTADSTIAASGTAIKTVNDNLISHINSTSAHSAANITETSSRRFITDAERTLWTNAANSSSGGNASLVYHQQLSGPGTEVAITLPTSYNYFKIIIEKIKSSEGFFVLNCYINGNNDVSYSTQFLEGTDNTVTMSYMEYEGAITYQAFARSAFGCCELNLQRLTSSNGFVGTWQAYSDGNAGKTRFSYGNFYSSGTGTSFRIANGSSRTFRTGMTVTILGVK